MKERLRKNRGKEPSLGSRCSEQGNVMSLAVVEMEKKQTLEPFQRKNCKERGDWMRERKEKAGPRVASLLILDPGAIHCT